MMVLYWMLYLIFYPITPYGPVIHGSYDWVEEKVNCIEITILQKKRVYFAGQFMDFSGTTSQYCWKVIND